MFHVITCGKASGKYKCSCLNESSLTQPMLLPLPDLLCVCLSLSYWLMDQTFCIFPPLCFLPGEELRDVLPSFPSTAVHTSVLFFQIWYPNTNFDSGCLFDIISRNTNSPSLFSPQFINVKSFNTFFLSGFKLEGKLCLSCLCFINLFLACNFLLISSLFILSIRLLVFMSL